MQKMAIKLLLVGWLFQRLFHPAIAQSSPTITNVSPSSASNGDRVVISGQNFIISGTDSSTYKVYLFMTPSGGAYLLASTSPNTNSTIWEQNTISFTIGDSIPRTGTISVVVGSQFTNWNGTFIMNGGFSPTPIPSPVPTVPVIHEPTSAPQETLIPTPSPTANTPTKSPATTAAPTKKVLDQLKISPTASPTSNFSSLTEPTENPTPFPTPPPKSAIKRGIIVNIWQNIISFLRDVFSGRR